jgi:hypothetical protein
VKIEGTNGKKQFRAKTGGEAAVKGKEDIPKRKQNPIL